MGCNFRCLPTGIPPLTLRPMSELLDELDARHAQLLSQLDELNERVEAAIEQHAKQSD